MIFKYKKLILVSVVFVFLFNFRFALAEVFINEVQIKPTGESFVELFNSGDLQDLTGWSIKRKTASGLEYSFVSASRLEGKSILSNSYFLIGNESDYIGSITLDATWAPSYNLANDNGIFLYDANGNEIDKIGWGNVNYCNETCPSNPTEGQSIQKNQSGLLIIATPTPRAQNYISSESSSTSSDNNSENLGGSSSTQNISQIKISEIPKIRTKIIAKNFAYVGIATELQGNTIGSSGESLFYGKYFWNFGDGGSEEKKLIESNKVLHTFYYPGDYFVSLDYYQNYYSENSDASDKIMIKVVPADISISNVGDESDFFIEISNNTNYEADISRWFLISDSKNFIFPQKTILQPKKKIILSPKISGFSISDKDHLKLLNQSGEKIFEYSLSFIEPIKKLEQKIVSSRVPEEKNNNFILSNIYTEEMADIGIEPKNLLASTSEPGKMIKSDLFYGTGLFLFLGIGAGTAYFVRVRNRKNLVNQAGNDFDILDE